MMKVSDESKNLWKQFEREKYIWNLFQIFLSQSVVSGNSKVA